MQNDAEGHEIETNRISARFMAADQELPFHSKALPWTSTAMQNDADGQETEAKSLTSSMWLGVDHVRGEPAASAEWPDLVENLVPVTACRCVCVAEVLAATL